MHFTPEQLVILKERIKEYGTDNCSHIPDFFYKECCQEHDIYYRTGLDLEDKPITRGRADKRLRECLNKHGKTPILGRFFLPWMFWMGVRLFAGTAWKGDDKRNDQK